MAKVRLRGQENGASAMVTSAEAAESIPESISLKPLQISGVVIGKEALVEALRVYVPQLEDVEVFEDGEQFFLKLRTPPEDSGDR